VIPARQGEVDQSSASDRHGKFSLEVSSSVRIVVTIHKTTMSDFSARVVDVVGRLTRASPITRLNSQGSAVRVRAWPLRELLMSSVG
jgi:hypothetical protein